MNLYKGLAQFVLIAHLTWIAWVIFGCLFTRHSAFLRWFHIVSLFYGIVIEAGPWYCPLTLLEQALMNKAGLTPYRQGFLIHYLQAVVYPDVSPQLLMWVGTAVCIVNLGVYVGRFWRSSRS
jgi:hypothetical protein